MGLPSPLASRREADRSNSLPLRQRSGEVASPGGTSDLLSHTTPRPMPPPRTLTSKKHSQPSQHAHSPPAAPSLLKQQAGDPPRSPLPSLTSSSRISGQSGSSHYQWVERALDDDDVERLRSLHTAQVSLWALPSIKSDSLLAQVLEKCPERGCPGRLWSLLLWRYSRPAWTRSCAACCR